MHARAGGNGHALKRLLAAVVLVGIYFLSTLGVVITTGVGTAQARGRGGGGRGGGRGIGVSRGRGFARGRGRGVGVYYGGYYDSCWWSPRYRRWICPYY
jgi:hypothetical protein